MGVAYIIHHRLMRVICAPGTFMCECVGVHARVINEYYDCCRGINSVQIDMYA